MKGKEEYFLCSRYPASGTYCHKQLWMVSRETTQINAKQVHEEIQKGSSRNLSSSIPVAIVDAETVKGKGLQNATRPAHSPYKASLFAVVSKPYIGSTASLHLAALLRRWTSCTVGRHGTTGGSTAQSWILIYYTHAVLLSYLETICCREKGIKPRI